MNIVSPYRACALFEFCWISSFSFVSISRLVFVLVVILDEDILKKKLSFLSIGFICTGDV